MAESRGALSGIRVVDLTDERGIYGAKLLADLGADVIRPEPPGGDALRSRGPHLDAGPEQSASLWHAFFASSRRFFMVDVATEEGSKQLQQLLRRADIVLTCTGGFASDLLGKDQAKNTNPRQVIIDTSSFGPQGPWRDFLAPDLVAGALGGFCATTGDADTPPLKGFGELNFMVSGTYVAIAALAALYHARKTGKGQQVDVSVHECIASCLEQVFMWYWYKDHLPMAEDKVLPRRGSLHWSNAYQVMQARGGSIMITPTPDPEAQIFWLVELDLHEDLLDEKYLEPENLPLLGERLMTILRKWAATRDVEELFFEAQARHSPYGWVLPIEKLADNPQLKARDWWETYAVAGTNTSGPGAPYRFSDTPWALRPAETVESDSHSIIADIGWEDS